MKPFCLTMPSVMPVTAGTIAAPAIDVAEVDGFLPFGEVVVAVEDGDLRHVAAGEVFDGDVGVLGVSRGGDVLAVVSDDPCCVMGDSAIVVSPLALELESSAF